MVRVLLQSNLHDVRVLGVLLYLQGVLDLQLRQDCSALHGDELANEKLDVLEDEYHVAGCDNLRELLHFLRLVDVEDIEVFSRAGEDAGPCAGTDC